MAKGAIGKMTAKLKSLDHLVLTVGDVRVGTVYETVLGMKLIGSMLPTAPNAER
ncbi:MAG: hypothetical protein R3D81_00810 [Thalassovita sp.]